MIVMNNSCSYRQLCMDNGGFVLRTHTVAVYTIYLPIYLILALPLSGDGIIFDLSFCVHLHCQGIGRLLLPAHLQRKLGHMDLWESSSISEILQKYNFASKWQKIKTITSLALS